MVLILITLGIDHFLLVIISIMLIVLIAVWGREMYKSTARQWNLSEESLCRCSGCGLIFVAKRIESVTRCPACQNLTRIRTKKAHKKMTY